MRKLLIEFSKKQITRYGLVLNQVQSKLIHWVLFPVIYETWGFTAGCVFLVIAISLMAYIQLYLYKKLQTVLHSAETIRRVENGEVKNLLQWALWILLKCNRFIVLFGLSTQFDPFIVLIYMMGSKKLRWHPFVVFLVALVVSMVYTILIAPLVTEGILWVTGHLLWLTKLVWFQALKLISG